MSSIDTMRLARTVVITLLLLLSVVVPTTTAFIGAQWPPTALVTRTIELPSSCTVALDEISNSKSRSSRTQLNMFMGSDGGLLGIGTPEAFTILLVGYFVLGPSDLYKLVKEIGKFITSIRTLGSDLSTTFESNMEDQLQLQELRKAQRELNDAFSFRRSINVDQEADAFATNAASPRPPTDASGSIMEEAVVGATAAAATTSSKKKIRRRKKVVEPVEEEAPAPVMSSTAASTTQPQISTASKPAASTASSTENGSTGNVPDLEMPSNPYVKAPTMNDSVSRPTTASRNKFGNDSANDDYSPEELAEIEREFAQYTSTTSSTGSSSLLTNGPNIDNKVATSRFQQQLSGNWNEQIMANEDKLSPLAKVMEMLALLEEEKVASTQRLEEEFKQRAAMDEEYYRKQRSLLEEAASQVQKKAYSNS